MNDRNKIAQALTVEELAAFVDELASLPGKERTLEQIKHRAALRGITISLMSAKAFRDTTFDRHLQRLRQAQEVATQIEAVERGGNTLADASAKLLSKRIFDQLLEAEDEDSAAEVDLDQLTLAVSRLRRGDQTRELVEAKLRETEAKLRDLERKEEERQEKIRAASREIEKLRNPDSGLKDSERAAIVATIDDILGIKAAK